MPRTTNKPTTTPNTPQNPPLVDVRFTFSSTRLATLQGIVAGLKSKNKAQPIYKTLQKCGEFTGQQKSNVSYVGYADGKIVKCGVVRCDNPECPSCGKSVASAKVSKLKKGLTAFTLDGGDLKLVTITMRPTRDPSKGISVMKSLKSKLSKQLHNAFRNHRENGLGYITMEKTFSTKWAHTDEMAQPCAPFAYLHTHIHMLVGSNTPEVPLRRLLENMKSLTKSHLRENGCYSHIADGNTAGFQVDNIDNTDELSSYLNKVVSRADQLALELAQDITKSGIGLGLNGVLDRIQQEPQNPLWNAHRKNIRVWFREMYRAHRTTEFNLDTWLERFTQQHQERMLDWIESRFDVDRLRAYAYLGTVQSPSIMKYWEGQDVVWLDDEWNPVEITSSMLERDTVVFREDVDTRLYNHFHRNGMESTLEHLFRMYHYEGRYVEVYLAYQRVNFGFTPDGLGSLMTLLINHSLIRGTKRHLCRRH